MPLCFVIMPYGGEDDQQRRRFEGIYQSIVVPAATRAGYDVKRSDIAGEPGNITHDIIRDLAEADVVVADLTEGNANVFFELGIRHVFRKSGTVHIVDRGCPLPFDIRQYRAITYSAELAELPDVITSIAEAIKRRETQPTRPDNPVHDAIPSLPLNVRLMGEDALRQQLEQSQVIAARLQEERDALTKKLDDMNPSWDKTSDAPDVDVDAILDEAEEAMRSAGEHVLLKLTEAAEAKGTGEFVRVLRSSLKSRFLEDNDLSQIANMCQMMGLKDHRRAVLEVAASRFPGRDAITLALADSYDDSPNPALKERGRLLIERCLGVKHEEAGPVAIGPVKPSMREAIGLLCNSYFHLGKPSWVLSIVESLERIVEPESVLIRNKAKALANLGRREEAENEYKRAVDVDPTDDTAHAFYSDFLDDEGRHAEAYEEEEKAILADPSDGQRFSNLGIQILNRGLVRNASGEIIGPVPRKDRIRFAMPLFMRALQDEDRRRLLRDHLITVLIRAKAIEEARAISEGLTPQGIYDDSALNYVEGKIRGRLQPGKPEGARSRGPNTNKTRVSRGESG